VQFGLATEQRQSASGAGDCAAEDSAQNLAVNDSLDAGPIVVAQRQS
jgi:hypothetical protein